MNFPYKRGWENQPNSRGFIGPHEIRIPSLKVGGFPSPIQGVYVDPGSFEVRFAGDLLNFWLLACTWPSKNGHGNSRKHGGLWHDDMMGFSGRVSEQNAPFMHFLSGFLVSQRSWGG